MSGRVDAVAAVRVCICARWALYRPYERAVGQKHDHPLLVAADAQEMHDIEIV